MRQNAPFCVLLKNNFLGGFVANPRPSTFKSLEGWHVWWRSTKYFNKNTLDQLYKLEYYCSTNIDKEEYKPENN